MATIIPRKNKQGDIISYQIHVFRGRSSDGHKLKPYIKTWKVPQGLSEKKIQKELNKFVVQFEIECGKGNVSIDNPTFEQYARYVIELKERNGAKHRTIYRYKSLLERVIDVNCNGIGHLKLQDIRAEHLNRLYITLSKDGQNQITGKGLSEKTILEHHRFISTVLSQAVKEQIIPYNTAQRATPPKLPKHEAECFEIDEVQKIIQAVQTKSLKWQALIYLFIATGARRGEILGLQWESVDFENNSLYLCNNLLYSPEKGIYSTTLKTGENRHVSIPQDVTNVLKLLQQQQSRVKRAINKEWKDTGYVFTQKDGKPMHPDSMTSFFRRLEKEFNLPHINPHKFRHTQASVLINKGVDIVSVSKRLGHSKTSTTSDIYAHLLKNSDEKVSNVIDDTFSF